jgi:hypothetical protein
MHKGFNRDASGKVHWDNNPELDRFQNAIKLHGGIIKKPHDLNGMQLWKQHIFDPVYYAFVDGKVNGTNQLKLEQSFRYITVSGKCYKELVSFPLLQHSTGMQNPLDPNLTADQQADVKKIKNSKEFRQVVSRHIDRLLKHYQAGWDEVYNYLQYIYTSIPELARKYGGVNISGADIQRVYDQRHQDSANLAASRAAAYDKFARARNFAHPEEDDPMWHRTNNRYSRPADPFWSSYQ